MMTVRKESIRVDNAYKVMKNGVSGLFNDFGVLVGRFPKTFSLVPLFVSLMLGLGLLRLKQNKNTEEIFTPTNSRIFRQVVLNVKVIVSAAMS
ncbi:hypothetical protein ACOMHN_057295 [Nucella lapillus]